MLAVVRPDSVTSPLLLHVLGAMLLVGCLFTVAFATVLGRRSPEPRRGWRGFGLKTLLLGVLPSYVLMRIGAQWMGGTELPGRLRGHLDRDRLHHRRHRSAADPDLGDPRRDRPASRQRAPRPDRRRGQRDPLAAFLVAVWAMTAKPT